MRGGSHEEAAWSILSDWFLFRRVMLFSTRWLLSWACGC